MSINMIGLSEPFNYDATKAKVVEGLASSKFKVVESKKENVIMVQGTFNKFQIMGSGNQLQIKSGFKPLWGVIYAILAITGFALWVPFILLGVLFFFQFKEDKAFQEQMGDVLFLGK